MSRPNSSVSSEPLYKLRRGVRHKLRAPKLTAIGLLRKTPEYGSRSNSTRKAGGKLQFPLDRLEACLVAQRMHERIGWQVNGIGASSAPAPSQLE
jgi:hypothetical protein